MASGGAPPFTGSGRPLVEYLEDSDLGSGGVAAPAFLSRGDGLLFQAGSGPTAFYDQVTGAPAYTFNASGIAEWRTANLEVNSGRKSSKFGFPARQSYVAAGTPRLGIRNRRYTWEGTIRRDSIGIGGAFEVGLFSSGVLTTTAAAATGIKLASCDTLNAGRWTLAWRFAAGPLAGSVDSGLVPTVGPLFFRFQLLQGVTRQLTVELGGVLLKTFAEAELPAGLDPSGSTGHYLVGWHGAHTGAATYSAIGNSRYRVEEV